MGTDASINNQLIDAAVAAKVKRFIPSKFGLDAQNRLARQLNKLKLINHLEKSAWEPVHVKLARMKAESDTKVNKEIYDIPTLFVSLCSTP